MTKWSRTSRLSIKKSPSTWSHASAPTSDEYHPGGVLQAFPHSRFSQKLTGFVARIYIFVPDSFITVITGAGNSVPSLYGLT